MDKIILKDKTEFDIAEGASLGNIKIQSKDFDGIKTITDAFSAENISKVAFTHNDQISGEYDDLKCEGFSYMPNMGEDGTEDGTYTVTVNLRAKTEMEKAIDKLKAGYEVNAKAIDDLASTVAKEEA